MLRNGKWFNDSYLKIRRKTMTTEWMTKEQVQKAAKGTLLQALECSREHHRQGAECGYEDGVIAIGDEYSLDDKHCALCVQLGMICSKCPLKSCNTGVFRAISIAKGKFTADRSRSNFAAFQEAEAKMVAKLDELIVAEKAKIHVHCKCKKCCGCGKTKAERIRVPDGIEFGQKTHTQTMSLLFNGGKQGLYLNMRTFQFGVASEGNSIHRRNVDMFLTPCKRSELKAGDWAYASTNSGLVFANDIVYYWLVLDSHKAVRVNGDGGVVIRDNNWTNWYKVIE
jgi:hypothetical protein